ncbi:MAG TPA: hypothetical protein VG897_11500, partial [Terriglobales bacterium]|nr:hypothetical protein [Terriglobales bacterium]
GRLIFLCLVADRPNELSEIRLSPASPHPQPDSMPASPAKTDIRLVQILAVITAKGRRLEEFHWNRYIR